MSRVWRSLRAGIFGSTMLAAGLVGCWEDTKEDGGPDAEMLEPDMATPLECELGERRCGDDGVPQRCLDPGGWVDQDPCPSDEECFEGECVPPVVCEANQTRCRSELILEFCTEDGRAWQGMPCGERCSDVAGQATCDEVTCVPGDTMCQGSVVAECNPAGTGFAFKERCNGERTGRECSGGECVPLCILTEKLKTNVGCDYWAVDLDNAFVPGGETGFLDAAAAPFAVVVSNPHPDFTGEVTVQNNEEIVDSAIIPPLGLHVFNLPRRDVDGTVIAPRAYRVKSTIPIVAYQFNPLDNEEVFSNDASLLLPSHVVGDDYYIMTREQSFDRLRGYLTVVAISEEPTTVDITVTARTQPGVGSIPGLNPGDTFQAVLSQFDVLNIETQAPGADLTGSRVIASQNVVVFGGSEAANAPNTNHCIEIDPVLGEGVCEFKRDVPCSDNYDCNDARLNTCCADHLEQQLFPIKTWGKNYVAAKSFDRGNEDDQWRIMASEDNTKVETVPPQTVIPILNAGGWFEFGSREHFEIVSDKPILVGQFLASEQAPGPNLRGEEPGDAGTGDPAFILAVSDSQFREDYVFLAPDKYAFDYVTVVAPIGADVFFDELPVPVSWETVSEDSPWQVARFVIGDGVHFIQSDVPVGVYVYGYDQYVSYGYPAGLQLPVGEEEIIDEGKPPAPEEE